MIRAIGGAVLIVLMSSGMFGQSAPSIRTFDVASVKVHQGSMRSIGISTSDPRLNADATNLRGLAMYAYNVRNYQVSSAAPLLTVVDTRFDIVAKAEGDVAPTKSRVQADAAIAAGRSIQTQIPSRDARDVGVRVSGGQKRAEVQGKRTRGQSDRALPLDRPQQ